MSLSIKFLGAAGTVTGSCFLIKTSFGSGLVDCGMFQGVDVEGMNYQDFKFNPKKLKFVVLTHAHLDHSGLLPKLVKNGYKGKIYATIPTRDIAEHMLLDSAKVQEMRYREKRGKFKSWKLKEYSDEAIALNEIIYDTRHVIRTLERFCTHDYGEKFTLMEGITANFFRVGHALGAAGVCINVETNAGRKKIIFSGDLGNEHSLLDSIFDWPSEANFIVMESLYGGLQHEKREVEEERLAWEINKTYARGGNIIMPVFTYQRSQEMLVLLKRLIEANKIPKSIKVYLDSPLSVKITDIYKKYFKYLNPLIKEKFLNGEMLFSSGNIIFTKKVKESKRIKKSRGAIIVAGHGMCAGGRILFHLLDNLSDKRASVLFVGFQAPGTLGREIIDGAREVIVEDKKVKVKANIKTFFGFSAHADNDTLLKWISGVNKKKLEKVFLIHSEDETRLEFGKILKEEGYNVILPKIDDEFILF